MIMKIGILGAADIAFRRFLPALQACSHITYAGTASRTEEKAARFQAAYGGQIYPSYYDLLEDISIDAVYLPLPPALHFKWGQKVLASGKHLLMEKPFTVTLDETAALLALAEKRGLIVHENYMFLYHRQFTMIKKLIQEGTLGELRLIRASFGFPKRGNHDFRYQKALGGGALLDCGGYPTRLALELLGENIRVVQAKLTQPSNYEVDLFGSAVLENDAGLCAQISFGMDNAYQCSLEVWGSQATLIAPRIFTAGAALCPALYLRSSTEEKTLTLPADDQFCHSIEAFSSAVITGERQVQKNILKQAELIDAIRRGNLMTGKPD